MKKHLFLFALLFSASTLTFAQKFMTRDGKVKFSSETPLEKIEGINKSASCILDTETGKMSWGVTIKSFKFEKALMEEHFNENYLESTKFPKASFNGTITNLNEVNLKQDGTYNAAVTGKMTIHGVTKDLTTYGVIKVAGNKIQINAGFDVACADYNIAIPAVVRDNIAKSIKVLVDAQLEPFKG
jgi:YceI-like domain